MKTVTLPNAAFFEEAKKIIDAGQSVTLTAAGNSMQPIWESRRVEIYMEQCTEVRLDDVIIALTTDNTYVAHRVIAINGDDITLMGDGNPYGTEHTTRSNIVGKITAYKRKGAKNFKPLYTTRWRIYSFIWNNARPIRRYLLAFYRRIILKIRDMFIKRSVL